MGQVRPRHRGEEGEAEESKVTRPRARSGARTAKPSWLQRALTRAFRHGLSFTECDTVFNLLPGEAERGVCEMMRGKFCLLAMRPPRG